jgi:peptidoglycan hydrolase-like protein with peptidoglycan-binding domain
MKAILYSACVGTLALALATAGAQAATDQRSKKAKPQQRSANVHAARPANTGRTMSAHRTVSAAQNRQRQAYAKPRTSSNINWATRSASAMRAKAVRPAPTTSTTIRQRNLARNERMRERNAQRKQEFRVQRDVAAKSPAAGPGSTRTATARDRNSSVNRNRNAAVNRDRNVTVNRTRDSNVNRERNVAVNRTRNTDVNRFRNTNQFRNRNNVVINRNRNVAVNRTQNAAYYRGGNVRVTNNWRGEAFGGQRYAAFRNYNRQWHDRHWWRSHYDRIIFVNNGWWYWNAGYWFPAWGYAPYVTYVYDGPIYGYNGLSPDQVTVNVQEALATAGYYDGPIDGILGPMTREAIAAYQADNGLAVTSAIDEPTLATMGLV